MAVTLAAARRLGAVHHRLEPTGHVHLQHLVTLDEIMVLEGQRDSLGTFLVNLNKMSFSHFDCCLTSNWWYFGLFL